MNGGGEYFLFFRGYLSWKGGMTLLQKRGGGEQRGGTGHTSHAQKQARSHIHFLSYFFLTQVRLNYHTHSSTITGPGPLELYVRYENDSSLENGFVPDISLTKLRRMGSEGAGWHRWEAPLPTHPQLR